MDILSRQIVAHAQSGSARPAILSFNRVTAYGELADRVARIANFLDDAGLAAGSTVFVNTSDPDLRLMAWVACLHVGLTPLIMRDWQVVRDDIVPDVIVAMPDGKPDMRADLRIDAAVLQGSRGDGRWRDFPEPHDDQIRTVYTTTGTTGQPKVVADDWGIWRRRYGRATALHGPDDRSLTTLSDSTRYAFALALSSLKSGAAIVHTGDDAISVMRMLRAFCVTWVVSTPNQMEHLLDEVEKRRARFPHLKRIDITGSLLKPETLERLERAFDADIRIAYGTTEVGGLSSGKVTSKDFRYGYVGEIRPGDKIITDGTREKPAIINVIRENRSYSHSIVGGELVRNESTVFRLPDLGYLDGYKVYLQGREDEVFNYGGNKYAFSLIENHIRALIDFRDIGIVSMMPLGDPDGLIIAIATSDAIEPASIARELAARMGIPSAGRHIRVLLQENIERNEMGKVDRRAIIDDFKRRRS